MLKTKAHRKITGKLWENWKKYIENRLLFEEQLVSTMIPLFITDGKAYVWNSEDWHTLRTQHRICGALIGSIASYPRQNDFLGLPMALLTEEVALLVEKGVCELYEIPDLNVRPSEEQIKIIKDCENSVLAEQTEALRKRKIEQLSQKIDIILAGKKKKLQAKGITDVQLDKQTLLQEEINKMPTLTPNYTLVHVPTEDFLNLEKVKVGIEMLKPNIMEKESRIRNSIYKDLWEKGHHITCGSKFGSDYLVYPGDPVKFHATYMVRCVFDQGALFSPASLVAFGRLSIAVNKLAVLAYCNTNGNVEYQTLQWHDST